MDAKTLITAEGLIVAALLVWGQNWVRLYDIYARSETWLISLALSALYVAVFSSLLSILLAFDSLFVRGRGVYKYAVALAGFSATIASSMVLLSAGSTFWKALRGWTQWHPLPFPWHTHSGLWTAAAGGAMAIALVMWLLWLAPRLLNRWN